MIVTTLQWNGGGVMISLWSHIFQPKMTSLLNSEYDVTKEYHIAFEAKSSSTQAIVYKEESSYQYSNSICILHVCRQIMVPPEKVPW